MAISFGPVCRSKSVHSRFSPARHACKLDTAYTLTVYPAPCFVMIYVLFIPTEKLYLFYTGNLTFMFTL